MEYFLKQLCLNFKTFNEKTAFHIEGVSYTYSDLEKKVAMVQQKISTLGDQQYFAVVTRNSIETFASIFALWLSGKTSVPISKKTPFERNRYILDQVGVKTIFDSSREPLVFDAVSTIITSNLHSINSEAELVEVPIDTDLYLLFTSGSTGLPKGVRISRKNLDAYLNAFFNCGYQIDSNDRCIEVFELTFDASVQCYTFPLMKGASVYTLPDDGIKFLSILKVLQQHNITFVKMTPSAIFYLQPYFDKIHLPDLRYCLFGAEAFPVELVYKWEKCIPNAAIHNVYGPTEATINCTFYKWTKGGENKSRNGIASIGKPYIKMKAIICDENLQEVPACMQGELCISGPQVTLGYWQDTENNDRAFFNHFVGDENCRFYRTGDLAIKDEEGDLLYIGRLDSQIQIDGHRVELGEIEHYARCFTGVKCVALAIDDSGIAKSIVLFIETEENRDEDIIAYLRTNIPSYMIPHKIEFVKQIPLLSSGKTDRQKLLTLI